MNRKSFLRGVAAAGALALLKAHIEAVRTDLAAVLKRTPGLVAEGRASNVGRKPRA
ncbi:MAG: hypothetical protein IBJ15_10480 [Alphaproteobacteria bacterium]|nr:hypothetical protein [Alphaproteobacteria bacterium]